MKSNKVNLIIIGISLIFLLSYVFFLDGIENIIKTIKSINPIWIIFSILIMVVYWLLEAIILHILVKKSYPKQNFKSTFKTSMIGQFFNCVTPFASGGQPIQAYHMSKNGVPLGIATSSLLGKFIIYQTVFTLTSIVIIIFNYTFFSKRINSFFLFIFIGLIVNIAVVLVLISVGYFNKFTSKCTKYIVLLLHKIKLVKKYDETLEYIDKELKLFYSSFKIIRSFKIELMWMSILSLIQILVYFCIPYFIYLSLGLNGANIIYILSANMLVTLVSAFIPLPGAIGGAEFSFLVVFKIFFPENLISVSVLSWRLITFYLPIIVGMFFTWGISKPLKDLDIKESLKKIVDEKTQP